MSLAAALRADGTRPFNLGFAPTAPRSTQSSTTPVLAWMERDWPFDSIEYAPRT
jgi:hypothetical protein